MATSLVPHRGPIPKDWTGSRFGRLVLLDRLPKVKGKHVKWWARCDCGREKAVLIHLVVRGDTRSCGCLRQEKPRIHGAHRTPEYNVWRAMNQRCHRRTHKQWKNYGGRGISVCTRWRHSFTNFIADMGQRPPHTTLERKDNDGDYRPGNVVWATWKEQTRNKRSNVILEFKGQRKTVGDWAVELGINRATLNNRLRSGWSVARALTEMVKAGRHDNLVAK